MVAPRTPLPRSRRLRAPLLLALGVLLGIEAVGGLTIFFARLAYGTTPGVALHVFAGAALTAVYAVYQWTHWVRVRPLRARLDYVLGVIAAKAMAATNLTGIALGLVWWNARAAGHVASYAPLLSAFHNIGSMLVLTFVGAHLGAVLNRDRRARATLPEE